ncbi:shikimate kinase [Luteibacter sp. Sphag1AF]|uniref:shikimate kinase n=1 Tax=Luteibacter sp. Sphag1AF TaxID=2587031 RepID=UPI00160A1219|nr:shikimate kinase [Luteibacter sp. Sphag1AF]MBB3225486.1 shikimate kinase [Luteibacter sp. Sphag1AF]
MNPSPNLFLVGPTGAGKTSIGRQLAEHYRMPFVDLDVEIESRCGLTISTIFEQEGEAGFRARECAHLDEFSLQKGIVLATGAGAVLDPANRALLRERGFVMWLQVSVDEQLDRLEHDRQRPLLAVPDRRGRLETLAHDRLPLYEALADLAFPGKHEPVESAAARAIALIDQHWSCAP